jgi:hypothetical protein
LLESLLLAAAVALAMATVGVAVSLAERIRTRVRAEPTIVPEEAHALKIRIVTTRRAVTTLVLDGVLFDRFSGIGPAGWPITLHLGRPHGTRCDEQISELITGWSNDQTVITLTRCTSGERQQVALHDGKSMVQLDLVA